MMNLQFKYKFNSILNMIQSISIKNITTNKNSTLEIEWNDGEKSNFNFMWLRDNCPTAH